MGQSEQLLRIGLYVAASWLLGDAVADGEMVQGAIGGVVNVVTFAWWYVRQRKAA